MNDPKLKEDILYAFAVEPRHDRDTLERYLRLHPGFAEDLIDLSYELRISETLGCSEIEAESDPGWQNAWEQFVACDAAKPETADNPFAQFKGQAFAELADELKMPRSLLTALRDRLPDPSSIPDRTIRRLAHSLSSTTDAVREYLALPPAVVGTLQFKADKKPSQQDRVSFEKLVQSSEMTDEQRKALLQDWDDDGPDRG
jgi:hypothetical protein